MTRKSRRELERAIDELEADVGGDQATADVELTEETKHDALALLRYCQQVAGDTGVHLDHDEDRDVLVKLLATARGNIGAGNVTADAIETAADTIGFEPGGS